jgi:hypothetical protein
LKCETALDFSAAETPAEDWMAGLETDPDVARDARLLVSLASDGHGSHRCTAVLGVRLEPVKYSWGEEPEVDCEINPTFVPARYWLASRKTQTPKCVRRPSGISPVGARPCPVCRKPSAPPTPIPTGSEKGFPPIPSGSSGRPP